MYNLVMKGNGGGENLRSKIMEQQFRRTIIIHFCEGKRKSCEEEEGEGEVAEEDTLSSSLLFLLLLLALVGFFHPPPYCLHHPPPCAAMVLVHTGLHFNLE